MDSNGIQLNCNVRFEDGGVHSHGRIGAGWLLENPEKLDWVYPDDLGNLQMDRSMLSTLAYEEVWYLLISTK